jgi:hypothetical protein
MRFVLLAPLFLAVFGVMFVVSGVQRLWGAGADAKRGEAVVWGSVGVMLGLGFCAAAVWLFFVFRIAR